MVYVMGKGFFVTFTRHYGELVRHNALKPVAGGVAGFFMMLCEQTSPKYPYSGAGMVRRPA